MNQEKQKIVIVGGVAGGASVAARARRLAEDAEIIMLERGPDVSFANCGLPYHVGGEIEDRDALAVQTPAKLKALLNLDVRTGSEVVNVQPAEKSVTVRTLEGEYELSYDKLVLAPGASPLRPPLAGIDDARVLTLRNLQDMDRLIDHVAQLDHVTIIGAGFIGLEVAEQLVHIGKKVTVVELQEQVLPLLDGEMTKGIEETMLANGVELILGDGIASFDPQADELVVKLNSGKEVRTELALLSIGVRPESELAANAGLELGPRGHIRVNDYMQTSDANIYAVGDVIESANPLSADAAGSDAYNAVPLGGPANRQGRTAADHIVLGEKAQAYPGTVGTAIVRVFDQAAGITGLSEKRLSQLGVNFKSVLVHADHHAGYYPGAERLTVKIMWDPESGRLLGGEAYGKEGVDKRLDVLATALRGKLTIDDLTHLELAYAPPFGSAKDPVNIAGFAAGNVMAGHVKTLASIPTDENVQIVDVRPAAMAAARPVANAINIPMVELRSRLGELDVNRPVATICVIGKTSYMAARVLSQNGFDAASIMGGVTQAL